MGNRVRRPVGKDAMQDPVRVSKVIIIYVLWNWMAFLLAINILEKDSERLRSLITYIR